MTESQFRIIIGIWLGTGLFLQEDGIIYPLLALLLLEGITNLRVPLLLSKLRSLEPRASNPSCVHRFRFEAERALRFIVVIFVFVPMQPQFEILWWLPWFVSFALVGAGLSGICPMVMALRAIGLR